MSDAVPAERELPLLTFEMVREIEEFPEFSITVTTADVAVYRAATGQSPTEGNAGVIPPGYAAIFGRLGYLRQHRMPGGGVLLGQEIEWLAPARVGEPLRVRSVVRGAVEDARGRRKVTFETTARQSGRPVAVVRITAGWPA
jgi:hypothetical protein